MSTSLSLLVYNWLTIIIPNFLCNHFYKIYYFNMKEKGIMEIIYKPCEKCGGMMECNSVNKKFCYNCYVKKRCERYKNEAQKKKMVKKKVKKPLIHKPTTIKCLRCGEKFFADGRRCYCDECRKIPNYYRI